MNAGDRYEYIMCTHTQTYICRIVRSMWLLRRYRELRTSSWRRKKQQQRTRKRWVIHPVLHSLAHSPHKMILTFFFIPGKGKKWEVAVGILSIFFCWYAMLMCDLIWHHCSVSRGSSITGMICVYIKMDTYKCILLRARSPHTKAHASAVCLWVCAKIQLSVHVHVWVCVLLLLLIYPCCF